MADPYFSEIKYRGSQSSDFAEVAVDEGLDVSNIQVVIYHPNGNIRSTNSLGSLDNTQFGKDVYTVNNGIHKDGAIALVQGGTVISFVSFDSVLTPSVGPAAGMTSTQIGSTGNNQNQSLQSTDGSSYSAGPINEGTVPCFLSGTLIVTQRGEVAVEDLRVGDRILVRDGGFEPLRWIGRVTTSARGELRDRNAPICIPRGAMGRGVPARDLYVSPNHRIWMKSPAFELYFEDREVLVPAKHLIGWKGVHQADYVTEPEYFHLLFDRHQIVISDGLPTESFHPGLGTVDQFSDETQSELLSLFPDLGALGQRGRTARRCLKAFEVPLALTARDAA